MVSFTLQQLYPPFWIPPNLKLGLWVLVSSFVYLTTLLQLHAHLESRRKTTVNDKVEGSGRGLFKIVYELFFGWSE